MIDDRSGVDLTTLLEDAAHFPGGHAAGAVFPRTTREVADAVAEARLILPIGAQSSLTGGATPMGELILATSKMAGVIDLSATHITVGAGLTIAAMQEHLAGVDAWFPPAPTFTGAFAGGVVATNAAGAATFKYGSTREWVEALTVVLADGTILELRRGQHHAVDGRFRIDTRSGPAVVPVPSYVMPDVAKQSAGYYARPAMDLVDLFIGSEGTLGIVTQVTFRILSPHPAAALALIPCPSEARAMALVAALRDASRETWRTGDPAGVDTSAIEHMDRRSIEILHDDGADARNHVTFPSGVEVALLVQLELPRSIAADEAYAQIGRALSGDDTRLGRFCRMVNDAGLLAVTELALPSDVRRAQQLVALREAVPAGVNQRVGAAKAAIDPRIEKTAADMIVPFDRFGEMMAIYRAGFEARGLDYAVWGHISDGNVHPNVIPRSLEDVESGKAAILAFGQEVARLGGCPLAEHGVGRNPVKQALLRQLYGQAGIDEMRAVKRALDPGNKLAPGVIFTTTD